MTQVKVDQKRERFDFYKGSLVLAGCIVLLAIQILLNLQISRREDAQSYIPPERTYKLDPKLFETLSFGHIGAFVDWIWITSLMDSSLEHVKPGTHPQFFYDLDLVTDLDSAYSEVYTAGANLLAVVRNDGHGARDLLLKGKQFIQTELPHYTEEFKDRFWPIPGNVHLLLGYVYLFELNDMPHAAINFREAATFKGAPAYLAGLAKRFERPGGEYEVGLKLLIMMIAGEKDSRVRLGLEKKKLNLFISQYLFELNHGFKGFLNTQAGYRALKSIAYEQMENYWKKYKRSNHISDKDPWGGILRLDSQSRITSTTPHQSVFGLE